MQLRALATIVFCCLSGSAGADLDDFIELDEEQTKEANTNVGAENDTYFVHRDLWLEGKDAPLIQFKIYTLEEHGTELIGSFDTLTETFRGKSETHKTLFMQILTNLSIGSKSQVHRVREYEIFDEFLALLFVVDYLGDDDAVYQQMQIMQWSDDSTKKCVMASESSERIAAFYQESVTEALIELMTYCAVGLNLEEEAQKGS